MQPVPPPFFVRTESGPLTLEFLGFPDVTSYDLAAGYVGACLEFACRWHLHRETIDRFDAAFAPILEVETGIKRGVDKAATERRMAIATKKDKVTPVPESMPRYIKRVFSKISDDEKKKLQALALACSRSLQIDLKPVERKTVVDAIYYRRADSLLEKYDVETLDEKVKEFSVVVPRFEPALAPDGRISRDSLAMLLYKYDEAVWASQD